VRRFFETVLVIDVYRAVYKQQPRKVKSQECGVFRDRHIVIRILIIKLPSLLSNATKNFRDNSKRVSQLQLAREIPWHAWVVNGITYYRKAKTVTRSRPKGERNGDHKAPLHTGGVLSTRPGTPHLSARLFKALKISLYSLIFCGFSVCLASGSGFVIGDQEMRVLSI
jgi:hypothetical protein